MPVVLRASQVTEGSSQLIELEGQPVAVFRAGGRYLAVDGLCPHAGAGLHQGLVRGTTVSCPWHGWRFRLDDGTCEHSKALRLGCYRVELHGEELWILSPREPSSLNGRPSR